MTDLCSLPRPPPAPSRSTPHSATTPRATTPIPRARPRHWSPTTPRPRAQSPSALLLTASPWANARPRSWTLEAAKNRGQTATPSSQSKERVLSRKQSLHEVPGMSTAHHTCPLSHSTIRACTVCRRLKMKCVGAEHGPPCKRCQTGNHECVFEESNRGKRSTK